MKIAIPHLAKSAQIFGAGLALGAFAACGSLPTNPGDLGAITRPSVSGDPCKNADWFEVGRVDGLNGIPQHASVYVGRCLSVGTAVNEELYGAGWQRGLVDYCNADRAFDAGRNGESYNGVCPKNFEAEFLKRFKVGSEISALEKKNLVLEGEVDRKLQELAALEASMHAPPTRQPTSESSRAPAPSAPTILKDATTRVSALQIELQKLRDDLARNEHAIRELENSASL